MDLMHIMPSVARSFGGPTQALVGYVAAARAAGIRVSVAAPACGEADRRWLEEQLGGAELHLFPGITRGSFMASPALIRWLGPASKRYDLVHVHGLLNLVSSLSARTAEAAGRPVVVRPFGTLSRYTFAHRRGWLKRGYFNALDRPNLRRARALHFTTAEERDEAGWHGVDFEDRSFVVPPPLALASAPSSPTEAGRPEVLFLSRLHPKKNIEALLEAWPRVLAHLPEARLTVAGDGEPAYRASLEALAAALGVTSSINFTGFVQGDAKAEVLARAAVFVLPSFQENFGVAVAEAIAAGLPVVITPSVQLASFVERHGLGRVADPAPAALAEAILQILSDTSLQTRCRVDGPRIVDQHFSPAAVGAQLHSMYERVLAH